MQEIMFISDLHLSAKNPKITEAFLHFLQYRACQASSLYILGDLFDFWVGDDVTFTWHKPIIQALSNYSLTKNLYFMRGNRDLLIGQKFCKKIGAILLPELHVVNLDNPVLLLHGDILCTYDQAYRLYRVVVNNLLIQKIFLSLPKKLRFTIGKKINAVSRNKHAKHWHDDEYKKKMDVNFDTVVEFMRKYQVLHMIHGHTHRPALHNFAIDSNKAYRWVLGSWESSWWSLSYKNGVFKEETHVIE